jgi:HD-GYP domain-containing protein (c-di-GMP phosphodiesterase class II)
MREDVTWGGLMTVHQHHERVDGRGYPARLTGDEIHELARICAIADVFDARLSDRSYHRALPLADVLEYLESQAGRAFDREMVRCWTSAARNKR